MTRRPTTSIVASPVLVGAVTLLVCVVAVLLAVQANKGLPFVPTYDIKAELPGGSNLLASNEVRVGGFRVGIVEELEPAVTEKGDQRAIAIAHMKLDKVIEPLPVDSVVKIRPRSALGLKFIEITPGKSRKTYAPGATIPLENSVKPIELDEFFGLNNDEFRKNQRASIQGYGTALAGRGESINQAIRDLVPFVTHLQPVMRNLSDPDTRLNNFFRQTGRTSAQIAPVARNYASLFVNMASTFEALSRRPDRLRGTIERAAPTLEQGIKSFPVQRPFLRDSEELARLLRPVAVEMQRSLPPAADAFDVGGRVLKKAPTLYDHTREVFAALDDLVENPNTLLALSDLHTTIDVATPLVEYVAPYQTVCSYWNYYWNGLGEHVSESIRGGTVQRTLVKSDNSTQDNRLSSSEADRPADIPEGQAYDARDPRNDPLVALHGQAGNSPAIDAEGDADCRVGQRGYLAGPLVPDGRYAPSKDASLGGGSHVVLGSDVGVAYGGTNTSRRLGIDNLEDVP